MMTANEPKHLSFSSLDLYDACALSWRAKYIDKVPERDSDARAIGILTHAAAELIVRRCEENQWQTFPLEDVASVVEFVFFTDDQTRTTALFGEVMYAAKLFARSYKHRIGTVIELEQWVTQPIGDGVPPLLGRLDQVTKEEDERGEFIGNTNLKTGWGMEENDRTRFQAGVESLLLHLAYPDYRIKTRPWFLRAGQPGEWFEPKPYDYENTTSRIIAIYKRRQASFATHEWLPTAGAQCSWCPIAIQCEHLQKLSEQGTVLVAVEDAQRAVLESHVLQAALDARKKSLKEFVSKNGPVLTDNGLEAAYRMPAPSLTITDKAALLQRMGAAGLELIGAPDGRKLKKLENDPRLAGLWETKLGKPRFTIGAMKDDDE